MAVFLLLLQMASKAVKNHLRILAGAAWAAAKFSMARALRIFRRSVESSGLDVPEAPKKMIRKWGKKLLKKGSVEAAHHNAGRKPRLTDDAVNTLVGELLGWRKAGLTAPYPSIKRFCYDNPIAKKICQEAGVTPKTVLKRLKAIAPSLGHARLRVKAKLSTELKLRRVGACRRLLRVPLKDLDWVVWVDAKTLYVNITHRHGWIDTATANREDLVLEHKLGGKIGSRTIQLKYYAAVNAKVGTVSLYFITGTTGLKAKRGPYHFKVRLSAAYCNHPWPAPILGFVTGSQDCCLAFFNHVPLPGVTRTTHQPSRTAAASTAASRAALHAMEAPWIGLSVCCLPSNSISTFPTPTNQTSVACRLRLNNADFSSTPSPLKTWLSTA